MSTLGLLLAAGQGSRMGSPKALVRGADGVPWLLSSRSGLLAAGCDRVLVVLGAESDAAQQLLGDAEHVVAPDWADGMSASLRAGLEAAEQGSADAVLIHLVDLPDVTAAVMRRVLAHAAPGAPADSLARAAYDGTPGHPVLVGRRHWPALVAELDGDQGARGYLARHGATLVECGDLATGADVDTPEGLPPA
ncbi:nucleotidyltransferase family protein [Nocardioides massiliensis]|nr:nucleotidyltransferase family protein [Nocardioides massiliensis]